MRRLLWVPDRVTSIPEGDLRRGFQASMLVSAVRCLLTYIALPFLVPAVGVAAGVGPIIGLPIGVVAIAANVNTTRRFWLADHRWRWPYTAAAAAVVVLLVILVGRDLADLLG